VAINCSAGSSMGRFLDRLKVSLSHLRNILSIAEPRHFYAAPAPIPYYIYKQNFLLMIKS
jgi:hypothetical protein